MNKKLKLSEVLNLDAELNTVMTEKISFLGKFDIVSLQQNLKSSIENFNKVRTEVIKKYGEKTGDGNYNIPQPDNKLSKEENLKREKVNNKVRSEIEIILNKDIDIKYIELPKSIFKGITETANTYRIIYKFIKM